MNAENPLRDLFRQAAERRPIVWDPKQPVRIFGTGNFARATAQALLAEGFAIDSFIQTTPETADFFGRPVHAWQTHASNQDTPLIIGIFNRNTSCKEIAAAAARNAYRDIRQPWDVQTRFGKHMGWRFWLSDPAILLAQETALETLHHRLADEESRIALRHMLALRLGLDDATDTTAQPLPQYVNELTLPPLQGRELVYVDGGAYDGDSLAHLLQHCPVKRAYLFEPDPANLARLVARGQRAGWPMINFPLGLFDRHTTLAFSAGLGEGSHLGQTAGDTHITVSPLDMLLPCESVDFIKLDIEGAEIPALLGARALIRRSRPILAISYYHRPDDLWRIPATLDDIAEGCYRFYIRLHGANTLESVLYAIPEG